MSRLRCLPSVGATRLFAVLLLFLATFTCSIQTVNANDGGYYTAEVKTILDAVLRELRQTPHRKFVWSEVSFFNRWYETLNQQDKADFQRLVSNGQIEFVNGGWVQNDEANPDPTAMINQMATGHEYLLKNFGAAPRIAWQIDPFGHSGVTPSLWSLMGFEALVINRIHHSLKDAFKIKKQMEFLWRGADVGTKSDMFTHVLHTHYSAPPGFDWEEGSIGIDAGSVGYRSSDFANIMRSRAQAYRSNHLLVPFGDDFKFKSADRQFSNMDRLMEHINADPNKFGMRVQYSTLSDYFGAVAASATPFPVFQGDFFPYADNDDSYWTGYYTTRPLLKQKSRKLNHILRACEMLLVLVRSSPHSNLDTQQKELPIAFWENQLKDLERARVETALFLHHDAITGTSRTNVVADYVQRMDSASEQLMQLMNKMIEHLLTKEPNVSPSFTPDPLVFGPPDSPEAAPVYHPVVYFNSLGWIRREVVSLQVSSRNTRVFDSNNNEIPCQIDVVFKDLSTDELVPAANLFSVSFLVEVPPIGATTYFVAIGHGSAPPEPNLTKQSMTTVYSTSDRKSRGANAYKSKYMKYETHNAEDQFIENPFLKLWFDPATGMVSKVIQKREGGMSFEFKQRFGRYITNRSGAYIFRPQAQADYPYMGEAPTIRITRGALMQTVSSRYLNYEVITQLAGGLDLNDEAIGNHVQVTQTVNAEMNHEIIATFSTSNFPTNEREFFTNSGIEFIRRTSREGNLAANFYPMVLGARMVSERAKRSYTILTTHSMAVGSHSEGELQLMMHRSLSQDDGRGLSEPVNDPSRLEIPLWISFEHGMTDLNFRQRSIRLNNPLRVFYKAPTAERNDNFLKYDHVDSPQAWSQRQLTTFTPLRAPLPPQVHFLTLLARDSISDDIIVRFQHLDNAKGTSWVGSFNDLFEETYSVSEVRRATLSLNTVLPMNGRIKRALKYLESPDAPSSPYNALAGLEDSLGGQPGASQNTNEEGVFLSQAALEKLRQDQLAARQKTARRLLEQLESQPDSQLLHGDSEVSQLKETELVSEQLQPAGRRLLANPTSTTAMPLFVVKPLQIQTYILRLSGADWAEQTEGIMVGVGRKNDGSAPVKPPAPVKARPAVVQQPTSSVDVDIPVKVARPTIAAAAAGRVPSYGVGAAGAGGARADNVLHGHEHTVIPGRTREAWKLIPSRGEYIFVLMASLLGVAFFLQALRVIARPLTNNGYQPIEMARRNKKSFA